MTLSHRPWVPEHSEHLVQEIAQRVARRSSDQVLARIEDLAEANRDIHEKECFNLNPATNVMNPRAEALLASGIGSRPSLGYPGDKYEMGLEAIEEIEVIAAELAAEVFQARYAEIRVPSGAIANLYGFMATCKPGDTIIAPPATVGGHVTHHQAGCAGLYGLNIVAAPVRADGYTVDVDALRAQPDTAGAQLDRVDMQGAGQPAAPALNGELNGLQGLEQGDGTREARLGIGQPSAHTDGDREQQP